MSVLCSPDETPAVAGGRNVNIFCTFSFDVIFGPENIYSPENAPIDTTRIIFLRKNFKLPLQKMAKNLFLR